MFPGRLCFLTFSVLLPFCLVFPGPQFTSWEMRQLDQVHGGSETAEEPGAGSGGGVSSEPQCCPGGCPQPGPFSPAEPGAFLLCEHCCLWGLPGSTVARFSNLRPLPSLVPAQVRVALTNSQKAVPGRVGFLPSPTPYPPL